MKIYSYLDAGKPVLATDLFTHTQVLTPDVSMLVKPEPASMSEGMLRLSASPELRARLAAKGRELMAAKYSVTAFKESLDEMYRYVESSVGSMKSSRQRG